MAYYIELDVFQGPLDLLLYLIEQQEIDAYHIPVAEVTTRYWEFLSQMGEMDLEAIEEFLLLGAELLALKARLLLQGPEENTGGEQEPPEEEPYLELSRRLEEYRRYKQAAEKLALLEERASLSYGRPLEAEAVARALARVDPLAGVALADLQGAFRAVLKRHQANQESKQQVHSVRRVSISLLGQQRLILRLLGRVKGKLKFRAFLQPQPTRLEVATTFIALLELVRQGLVFIYQPEAFAEIEVWRRE